MSYKEVWIVLIALSLAACRPSYQITNASGNIVLIDSSFDIPHNDKMMSLVNQYKTELDKEMNTIIGHSAQYMEAKRPESLLTNLTADVMKKYGDEHLPDGADLSVINVHGHRSTLPEGDVTTGSLFEIYSFDNTITFVELKGDQVSNIFNAYARIGGAGISSNVRLEIEGGKVKSATIDNKPVDNNRTYRIVTVDYLSEGNDNMGALRNATSKNDTGVTLRDVMIDWVKERTRQGEKIQSAIDGRITIIE